MKGFSLQGQHKRQCTCCDDRSMHLSHRLYSGFCRSYSRFWGGSLRKIGLYGSSNGSMNLLDYEPFPGESFLQFVESNVLKDGTRYCQ